MRCPRSRTLAALAGAVAVAATVAAPPAGAATGLVVDPAVLVTYMPGLGGTPANQSLLVRELVIPARLGGELQCTGSAGQQLTVSVTGGLVALTGSSAAPETPLVGVGNLSGTLTLSGYGAMARPGVVSAYTEEVVVRMDLAGTYARVGSEWDLHFADVTPQAEIRNDPDLACDPAVVVAEIVAAPVFADGQTSRLAQYLGSISYLFLPTS